MASLYRLDTNTVSHLIKRQPVTNDNSA
jgi:hypothetical protein